MFRYNRIDVLGISIYETVCMKGETQLFKMPKSISKELLPNVLVFAGDFTYGPFPNVGLIRLKAGSTGEDLPDRSEGEIAMTALKDGAQYYCIHRMGPFGHGPRPDNKLVNIKSNTEYTIPMGHVLVLGKGKYEIDGIMYEAPQIIAAKSKDVSLRVKSNIKGLEVWE